MRSSRKKEGKGLFRRKPWRTRPAELLTIDRVYLEGDEDGPFEYSCTTSSMRNEDLPPTAVHVTRKDGVWGDVAMEPRYPPYSGVVDRDEDGNPIGPANLMDAQGYYTYSQDDRISKAEQSLSYKQQLASYDWKKILTIIAAGLVVLAVVYYMEFR